MNNDYISIYRRRLNRYGLDYQSRIQAQREREFDDYLYKTIYRVDFEFEHKWYGGSLERYKQDYTETQCYLLTQKEVIIFLVNRRATTAFNCIGNCRCTRTREKGPLRKHFLTICPLKQMSHF